MLRLAKTLGRAQHRCQGLEGGLQEARADGHLQRQQQPGADQGAGPGGHAAHRPADMPQVSGGRGGQHPVCPRAHTLSGTAAARMRVVLHGADPCHARHTPAGAAPAGSGSGFGTVARPPSTGTCSDTRHSAAPVPALLSTCAPSQILPDLALWEYRGTEMVHGQAAGLWVLEQRCAGVQCAVHPLPCSSCSPRWGAHKLLSRALHPARAARRLRQRCGCAVPSCGGFSCRLGSQLPLPLCRHGPKHTVYRFLVASDGAPLRLHMHGNDMFSGAHFDVCEALPGCHAPVVCSSSGALMCQRPRP